PINVIEIDLVCFFFFFQAEDGIRDFHVTGVQTCALPISTPVPRKLSKSRRRRTGDATTMPPSGADSPGAAFRDHARLRGRPTVRSEERRVGKIREIDSERDLQ